MREPTAIIRNDTRGEPRGLTTFPGQVSTKACMKTDHEVMER